MTLDEKIKTIMDGRNSPDLNVVIAVANFCRFKLGLNYREIYERIEQILHIDLQTWEEWLNEAESIEFLS